MKTLISLLTLLLTFSAIPLWAQEKEAPAEPTEEKTEAAEDEDAQPKKAQRLPSSLKRQRNPSSEDGSMALLGEYLSEDSLIWLNTEFGRFLSVWQKDRSGDPKGALLIIHAEGEHPAWPNTTKPLHDTLPDAGWATLAISFPAPDERKVPQRTFPTKAKRIIQSEEDESNEESEGGENSDEQAKTAAIAEDEPAEKKEVALPAPAPAIQADEPEKPSAELVTEKRLEAALQFLHDQGQFNLIVLGSGSGAIRAHDFIDKITPKIDNPKLKAKLERPIRAMVIVNARNRLPIMEEAYQNWFSDPEIPVLDIFVQDNYRNKVEAKKRKVLARQKKVVTYKQVRLNSINPEKSWNENSLSRRIRSFLDTNAVGIEVKNAKVQKN
ncbi:MAG: DUF3530 family protein [Cellvibrionaceae bacterium]